MNNTTASTYRMTGSIMERSDNIRQHVSDLVDGETDPEQLEPLLRQLAQQQGQGPGEGRAAWDLYHQIGDALRSTDAPPAISPQFGARFAQRFASEPVLLPVRRSLLSRLGDWPTTLAAVAAAGFGFLVAPAMLRDQLPAFLHEAPLAQRATDMKETKDVQAHEFEQGVQVARRMRPAVTPAAIVPDYIALHHSAHPSLYGAMPTVQSAGFEPASNR